MVLKGGGDLISGHEGGTEEATLAILENAKGKVLVIDEAYMLDGSNYGKIALDMIVSKVMGSPGEDIAVLLLGYEDLIMKMINNQNPGLKRYFTFAMLSCLRTTFISSVSCSPNISRRTFQAFQPARCTLLSRLQRPRAEANSQGATEQGKAHHGACHAKEIHRHVGVRTQETKVRECRVP